MRYPRKPLQSPIARVFTLSLSLSHNPYNQIWHRIKANKIHICKSQLYKESFTSSSSPLQSGSTGFQTLQRHKVKNKSKNPKRLQTQKRICKGKGLCPVKIITGHIRIRTHVQEWTRVFNPTYPVLTFTGQKLHPYAKGANRHGK